MVDEKQLLAQRVQSLRLRAGLSVAETSRRSGLSASMLWKVEQGQTTLTYGKLVKLAEGLGVPIGELFAPDSDTPQKRGRRVIDRKGHSPVIDFGSNLHHFLATEISGKPFFPILIEVHAFGDNAAEAHGGEEFAFVVEGKIEFRCEGYVPAVLDTGDSVYFDATQPHRYLRAVDNTAKVICVYSRPANKAKSGWEPLAMQKLSHDSLVELLPTEDARQS